MAETINGDEVDVLSALFTLYRFINYKKGYMN